ncbi:MAG: TOBE domain-containing protein [Cyanobacteria bacterium CRU_2_1]|nr:TOBE domain-containing protein [Cyanobacteria bacterium RU_5_0]NJR63460.1 TOBE domain-containing protein [Cyanobacteria bacterium CRU_2_1]
MRQAVKISARNVIKAKVKQIVMEGVTAEVVLSIAPDVEIVSRFDPNKVGDVDSK